MEDGEVVLGGGVQVPGGSRARCGLVQGSSWVWAWAQGPPGVQGGQIRPIKTIANTGN